MPDQIIILQVSEDKLRQIIAEEVQKLSITQPSTEKHYVTGLSGLAEYFGCGITKAQSIKNRMPSDTYFRDGKLLCFHSDKLKSLKLRSFKK